ncbi:MAG: GNAT family N-acetyltransferase [Bacteroidetes bacterium]|nr:GNAT family N-acetyltransferase [Bacteroidota bacterium]
MIYRRANSTDIPQMLPLWRYLIDIHAPMERMFETVEGAESKFAEFLKSLLDKENYLIAVAEDEGKIAGYVISHVSQTPEVFVLRRKMYVQDMVIEPAYRRQGVARKLMDVVLAFAKEQQVEKIDLLVAVQNEGANKFWREMGFHHAINYMNLYLS